MDKKFSIILVNNDETSFFDLDFTLENNSIADKWLADFKKIHRIRPDDPERFYNFPGSKFTRTYVAKKLNEYAKIVNNYLPNTITRVATPEMQQDDLNYFHHIFEVYHGLYDQQKKNQRSKNVPPHVLNALSNINIYVHRFESFGDIPRFVCTWFNKPPRKLLTDEEYDLFTFEEGFGDLFLNYCEIGKTLYDHWHDQDEYATLESMLKPQNHYSADFTVRFGYISKDRATSQCNTLWEYVKLHEKSFNELGFQLYDKKLSLGRIPLAKLQYVLGTESKILEIISNHQRIHSFRFH